MDTLFALLFVLSLIGLIGGLISPRRFAFWTKRKTRKAVLKGYLSMVAAFLVLTGVAAEEEPATTVQKHSPPENEQVQKNEQPTQNEKAKKDQPNKPSSDEKSKQSKQEQKAGTNGQVPVTLSRTVDGDTIKVVYHGKEETVRYLLVDTPESKKPNSCVQPFAEKASERNEQLVSSGKLTLEFEKSERDKYGRLLAYVFVDGKSVQETLLREGYARVAYIYEPPYKYLNDYEQAEQSAEDRKLNIWSKKGYVTDRGFNGCASNSSSGSTTKKASAASASAEPARRTVSSKAAATSTEGNTEDFQNCTELRKQYPNGVPASHPAYQSKMDRDHDNYACER